MPDSAPIALIVLAAGRSSRMGAHKLLLPLRGQPLVSFALRLAERSTAADILLVLGYDVDRIRHALPRGRWRIVESPDFASGMSASLRAGLLATTPDALGAAILLADQPFISDAHLQRLLALAVAAPERIVATLSAGRAGSPVYFPRSLFGELLAVTGDEGGRSVIARHRELLLTIEAEGEDELLDIDDPASFQRALALLERDDHHQ